MSDISEEGFVVLLWFLVSLRKLGLAEHYDAGYIYRGYKRKKYGL